MKFITCLILACCLKTNHAFTNNILDLVGKNPLVMEKSLTKISGVESNNPYVSELPDSFEDSVKNMVFAAAQAKKDNINRLKIVFDTSNGDATYTTLKKTLPMVQQFVSLYANFILTSSCENSSAEKNTPPERKDSTIRVYFPDAGSAALTERDWKLGSPDSLVPNSVRLDSVTRDQTSQSDEAFIILCPRAPEAEDTLRVVTKLSEEHAGKPIVLINPDLVDMGITGYGMAGRLIRERLLDTFTTIYYLRTLELGALTKQYSKSFSLWREDEKAEGGYRLVNTMELEPSMESIEELFEVESGVSKKKETPGFLNAIADFVTGMQRL